MLIGCPWERASRFLFPARESYVLGTSKFSKRAHVLGLCEEGGEEKVVMGGQASALCASEKGRFLLESLAGARGSLVEIQGHELGTARPRGTSAVTCSCPWEQKVTPVSCSHRVSAVPPSLDHFSLNVSFRVAGRPSKRA